MNIVTSQSGDRVLSRIGTNPTYWAPLQLAECLNHRYTVKFPTMAGARKAAGMHGAQAVQVDR